MAVIGRESRSGVARVRGLSWSLAIVPLSAALLLLAVVFAADVAYTDRALPGVTVAGVDVGSLERAALEERLQAEIAVPWAQSSVVATYEGRTWRTTNGALEVRPDRDAAVAAALAYGKTGTIVDRIGAWFDAVRGNARVPMTLRAEGGALATWMAQVASDVDRATVDGVLAIGPTGLEITEPVIGKRLDHAATAAAVLAARTLGDREIALSVTTHYPAVDASGLREARAKAQAVTTPLVVTVEDRRVTEDAAGLATLLTIERVVARSGELDAVPAGAIAPAERYRYAVSLNPTRIDEWVAALGGKLDRPAIGARFTVNADSRLTVVPGVAGIRLEQDKMKALLQTQLFEPVIGTREIAAPSAADTTALTTQQAMEWLPQMQRTSSFTTYFPANRSRHANIATGASQFDGVVIMPGQTFSFWDYLGPVTVERGYAYAGAIIEGRSDENVIGGGLCQVSTTMFNAVARLGYRIDERHAHGYYIDRYPIGLDAAVFLPGVDFRWTNDTASPVFMWSWVSATSVTFEVWGLPTGRTVTFSDAVQRNFVNPRPDQPADPAFPRGVTVQGRDVWRTRTVVDGGRVLYQDSWASHYVPVWGGPAAPAPTQPSAP